jgi:hypothetical protein
VLGIQNGRGYKINPLAEKVVALCHRKIEEAKNQTVVNYDVEPSPKEEVQTRKTQSYSKKKTTINQLRNL